MIKNMQGVFYWGMKISRKEVDLLWNELSLNDYSYLREHYMFTMAISSVKSSNPFIQERSQLKVRLTSLKPTELTNLVSCPHTTQWQNPS
jgi:hypothetical protein